MSQDWLDQFLWKAIVVTCYQVVSTFDLAEIKTEIFPRILWYWCCISGSFWLSPESFLQVLQFQIKSSIAELIFGQETALHALCLFFCIPRCDRCNCCSISFCNASGMMTLLDAIDAGQLISHVPVRFYSRGILMSVNRPPFLYDRCKFYQSRVSLIFFTDDSRLFVTDRNTFHNRVDMKFNIQWGFFVNVGWMHSWECVGNG